METQTKVMGYALKAVLEGNRDRREYWSQRLENELVPAYHEAARAIDVAREVASEHDSFHPQPEPVDACRLSMAGVPASEVIVVDGEQVATCRRCSRLLTVDASTLAGRPSYTFPQHAPAAEDDHRVGIVVEPRCRFEWGVTAGPVKGFTRLECAREKDHPGLHRSASGMATAGLS